jgi:release factor glutamine methyltransferase
MNTIKSISLYIHNELSALYPKREIQSFIYLIFEHLLNLSKTDVHIKQDEKLSDSLITQINSIVGKLEEFTPIQYIFGKTEFYDLKINVTPEVLIPRPETEELVDWIIAENIYRNNGNTINIIDIGTGSGCIAISLAKHFPNSGVDALDISEKALHIAKQNAIENNVNINFLEIDILNWQSCKEIFKTDYDIIVSNPPYVRELEKQFMQSNVLDYEPKQALFVTDSNPFIFYEAISCFAREFLNQCGGLYFEINEYLANDTFNLLKSKKFDAILKKDINGKDRMIKATGR